MIRVQWKKTKDNIVAITFLGHAMYDDYGKDIVCAGVSSILIKTVNAILKLESDTIKVTTLKDKVIFEVLKVTKINQKLILNMLEMLKEVEENYPKNITIREDEKNE